MESIKIVLCFFIAVVPIATAVSSTQVVSSTPDFLTTQVLTITTDWLTTEVVSVSTEDATTEVVSIRTEDSTTEVMSISTDYTTTEVDVTTSVVPTTEAPDLIQIPLPVQEIVISSEVTVENGDPLSGDCVDDYQEVLENKTQQVLDDLETEYGGPVCGHIDPDFQVFSDGVVLYAFGGHGHLRIHFFLPGEYNHTLSEQNLCGTEISNYLRNYRNWGIRNPINPQIKLSNGCPYLDLQRFRLSEFSRKWIENV